MTIIKGNKIPFIQNYSQLSRSISVEVRVKRKLDAKVISVKMFIVSKLTFYFKTLWRTKYCT